MERPPFKFQIGDKVVIGETAWPFSSMKRKKGKVGMITDTTFIPEYGNGNHYEIDNGLYFEEDCLTLKQEADPIKEITNDEINNILQG